MAATMLAALAGLMVLWSHLAFVEHWASPAPFGDQWDGELLIHYLPAVEGTLGTANFFTPYNGINLIATKRLLDHFLFTVGGNVWDPLNQIVAGVFIFALTMAVLTGFCARWGGWVPGLFFVAWLLCLSLAPVHWENVLWGFQTSIHLYLLFSVAAFAAASQALENLRWIWSAIAFSVLAALSFGAAFLTAICIIVALCMLPARGHIKGTHLALALVTGAVIAVHLAVLRMVEEPRNAVSIDLDVVTRALGWPLSEYAPWSVALCLPFAFSFIWLAWMGRRDYLWPDPQSRMLLRLLSMLWLWSFAQQLLVRLLRDGTSSRHLELLWFVWLAPMLMGALLWQRGTSRLDRRVGFALLCFGTLASFGAVAAKFPGLEQVIDTYARSQSVEFLALDQVRNEHPTDQVLERFGDRLDDLNHYILVHYAFDLIRHPSADHILSPVFDDPEFSDRMMQNLDSLQTNRLAWLSSPTPANQLGRFGRFAINFRTLFLVLAMLLATFLAVHHWSIRRQRSQP